MTDKGKCGFECKYLEETGECELFGPPNADMWRNLRTCHASTCPECGQMGECEE